MPCSVHPTSCTPYPFPSHPFSSSCHLSLSPLGIYSLTCMKNLLDYPSCNIHVNTHFSISISVKIPLLTTSRCQGSGRSTCTQRQPRRPPALGSIPPHGSPAMGALRRRRRGCYQQMSSSSTTRFRPTKLSTLPRRLQQQALHRHQAAVVGHVRGGAGGWQLGPTPRTSGDASLTSAFSVIVFLR